jgi:hypothetical protein
LLKNPDERGEEKISMNPHDIQMNKSTSDSEFKRKKVGCYLLVAAFFIWAHSFTEANYSDDAWFSTMLDQYSILGFLNWRFHTWSSRVILEGILVVLAHNDFIVWRILDILVCLLLVWAISQILDMQDWHAPLWITLSLCLLPVGILCPAGWIATSTNYLWPLTAGMVSLVPLVRSLRGDTAQVDTSNKQLRILKKIASLLMLVVAANQEQIAAVLFGVYLCHLIGWYVVKRREMTQQMNAIEYEKKPQVYPFLPELVILLASLAFIVLCPGNTSRNIQEMSSWFPEYPNYSMGERLLMGMLDTVAYFGAGRAKQIILIVFVGILILVLDYKYLKWSKVRDIEPLKALMRWGFSAIFGEAVLLALVLLGFPVRHMIEEGRLYHPSFYYDLMANRYLPQHDQCLYQNWQIALELGLYGLAFLAILGLLWAVADSEKEAVCMIVLTVLAMGSKAMLGFSPTVYASGYRTAFVGSVILLVLGLHLLQKLPKKLRLGIYAVYLLLVILMLGFVEPGVTF